jgi:hypothetical protein
VKTTLTCQFWSAMGVPPGSAAVLLILHPPGPGVHPMVSTIRRDVWRCRAAGIL